MIDDGLVADYIEVVKRHRKTHKGDCCVGGYEGYKYDKNNWYAKFHMRQNLWFLIDVINGKVRVTKEYHIPKRGKTAGVGVISKISISDLDIRDPRIRIRREDYMKPIDPIEFFDYCLGINWEDVWLTKLTDIPELYTAEDTFASLSKIREEELRNEKK
jgi:hypothetical protein